MSNVRELKTGIDPAPLSDAATESGGRLGVPKTYKLFIGGEFPRTESGRFFKFQSADAQVAVNLCQASRKDLRDAVVAARKAFPGWAAKSAYNRGQILYRIAEVMEGRREQFVSELQTQGSSKREAQQEVDAAIDRLVYYAGWSDKYQQLFSSVNPVASSHFNFSLLEPTGVVSIFAPEESALLGLVSVIAPAICGGNAVVVLASQSKPLSAVTFSEVLHSSDLPGGVVNLLTGFRKELSEHLSSHMDINAVVYSGAAGEELKAVQQHAALNVKRVVTLKNTDWFSPTMQGPYLIRETQEVKTTWHPVGM